MKRYNARDLAFLESDQFVSTKFLQPGGPHIRALQSMDFVFAVHETVGGKRSRIMNVRSLNALLAEKHEFTMKALETYVRENPVRRFLPVEAMAEECKNYYYDKQGGGTPVFTVKDMVDLCPGMGSVLSVTNSTHTSTVVTVAVSGKTQLRDDYDQTPTTGSIVGIIAGYNSSGVPAFRFWQSNGKNKYPTARELACFDQLGSPARGVFMFIGTVTTNQNLKNFGDSFMQTNGIGEEQGNYLGFITLKIAPAYV
jgi:hypothetical protein